MLYFGYERPRKFQEEMLNDIYSALIQKKSIIINAPTGIGKTDAAIGAGISVALEKDLDLFFVTPKISQHKIAIEALQRIKDKYNLDFLFVDFVGKQNMCLNTDVQNVDQNAFYELCERKIKKKECPFFENYLKFERKNEKLEFLRGKPYHTSLLSLGREYNICAYELTSLLARSSRAVVCDYAHVLSQLNQFFLKKIKKDLERSILIFDEAHNILQKVEDYYSTSISSKTIKRAQKELEKMNANVNLSFFEFKLEKLAESKLSQINEAFLSKDDLADIFGVPNVDAVDMLEEKGLEYAQNFSSERVALLRLAKFFYLWENEDEDIYRIIEKTNSGIKIHIKNFYPKEIKEIFSQSYANVFMSATLQPLEMYKNLFGVEGFAKSYPSSFPKGNRMVLIDTSSTTKFEERSQEEYKRIAARINEICESIPGNVACFFPSYTVLNNVYRYLSGEVIIQREKMKSAEIQEIFQQLFNSKKAKLLGVMGGSLSEGVDYPRNILKGIIIVGIPLEKPTLQLRAKINLFEKKFGSFGRKYAYIIPAIIRAVQAAGRAIRSESDKAVIVFMDKRYSWKMYNSILENFQTELLKTDSIEIEKSKIKEFWSKFSLEELYY